jgi:large subunit ribosomal protein L3
MPAVGAEIKGPHMLGTKLGMTRVFDESGASVPVTVLSLPPNIVTQVRTAENDGYSAVQIAYGEMKPRNSTMPLIGHDAKAGASPKRHHREFRVEAADEGSYQLGQEISLDAFDGCLYVDVIATSKGKGFAGTMKRFGFKGQQASHGVERKHRSPGSIGGHATNRGHSGKLKKGKRMTGHLGADRVTVRSLDVIRIDKEQGLMLVKGPVPGHAKTLVEVRPAVRLYKSKATKQAGAK